MASLTNLRAGAVTGGADAAWSSGEAAFGAAVVSHANRAVAEAVNNGIRASYFGIRANAASPVTEKLREAINWCSANNRTLLLPPGVYPYDDLIGGVVSPTVNKGLLTKGIVAVGGRATLMAVADDYATKQRWSFGSHNPSEWISDVVLYGIDFYNYTRPDDYATTAAGAAETGGFARFERIDGLVIANCRAMHNEGGGFLQRDVRNSIIVDTRVEDCFKDNFHITGASENCWTVNCTSVASGDDAFAVVGYYDTAAPRNIFHIGNKAFGTRTARGFAYVGGQNVYSINNYYDGRVPEYIPQRVSTPASGSVAYRGSCGLYVAGEAGAWDPVLQRYKSRCQGTKNLVVRGMTIVNTAKAFRSTDGQGVSTYSAIHIWSNWGGDGAVTGIDIEASVRDTQNNFVWAAATGTGKVSNLRLNINGSNCTDPEGWNPAGTKGAGTALGIELLNTHNVTVRGRLLDTGTGAIYADSNCTGYLDIDVELGRNNTAKAVSADAIHLQSGIKVSDCKIVVRYAEPPPYAAAGATKYAVHRLVEATTSLGRIRGINLLGNVGAATFAVGDTQAEDIASPALGNLVSGFSWQNNTGEKVIARVVSGTADGIGLTSVERARGRRLTAVAVAGNTASVRGDLTTTFTASAVVHFYAPQGEHLGTGTVASSAHASGVTTVTFSAALPAAVVVGTTVAPVPSTWATVMQTTASNIHTVSGNQVWVAGHRTAAYPVGGTAYFYTPGGQPAGSSAITASVVSGANTQMTVAALPTGVESGYIVHPTETSDVAMLQDARRMYYEVLPGEWLRVNWQFGGSPHRIERLHLCG